ncbi:phospholipid phosphatase-related protein type 4 [Petromyzon marinus]|uniref:phospholipid phosphatase-related protein type 4 n=1 Tax=Petromyzon marinus TaxID=7757 RepID=UPI003F7014D0
MAAKDKSRGRPGRENDLSLPCFYFVEVPIIAAAVVSLYFLELTNVFVPAHVGFQCHERGLSLPYVEPARETVPLLMLFSLAFAVPSATIMIGEGIVFCCLCRRQGSSADASGAVIGCNFSSYLRRAVRFVGVHVFGLCAALLVADILQLSTGFHAPYFLTVCKPNYTLLNTSCDESPYVMQDICTGQDANAISAGRKTFPSEHATIAAFAAIYISIYFNSVVSNSSKLLKPLLVFAFELSAGVCGLTRVVQHKSHPGDVYAGFLLGTAIAWYLGYHAVDNFEMKERKLHYQARLKEAQNRNVSSKLGRKMSLHRQDSGMNGLGSDSEAARRQPDVTLSRSHSENASVRALNHRASGSSEDMEILPTRHPMGKESMVTFSNTLPRASAQPPAAAGVEDVARRHVVVHAATDPGRAKQKVDPWRPKAEGSKVPTRQQRQEDCAAEAQRAFDVRTSSEHPCLTMGVADVAPKTGVYLNVQASGGGPAAAAALAQQQQQQQLVHIPEETPVSPHTSPKGSSARAKWLMMAEKGGAKRGTQSGQPRLIQVINMSKQQGLLQAKAKQAADPAPVGCAGGPVRYKNLPEQLPVGAAAAPLASTSAAGDGGDRARSLVHVSANDGVTSSWKWKPSPQDPESYELNDLGRHMEPGDEERMPTPHSHSNSDLDEVPYCSPSGVNAGPMLGTKVALGELSELAPPEPLSLPSSRDSTLRRKPSTILVPERSNNLENTRNVFYKGTSSSRGYKD